MSRAVFITALLALVGLASENCTTQCHSCIDNANGSYWPYSGYGQGYGQGYGEGYGSPFQIPFGATFDGYGQGYCPDCGYGYGEDYGPIPQVPLGRTSRPKLPMPRQKSGAGNRAVQQATPLVRQDVKKLGLDSRTLQSYRRAVQAMKNLPASDPHNWNTLANAHAAECQHGNWWFLPWHRAYLYYFERIVRRYAGDPAFTLPYWDPADTAARTLPAAFRDPQSPLWDGSRRFAVNRGEDELSEAIVVSGTQESMANTVYSDFNPDRVTFGGAALASPQREGQPHGALESVPHDMVHIFVGGNMADLNLAARDPIFWLHHANIDRLWAEWLAQGQGRANPANDVWLNQVFTFGDENKQRVSIPVRRLLNTQDLGYVYESAGSLTRAARTVVQTPGENIASVVKQGRVLGSKPVAVTLPIRRNGTQKGAKPKPDKTAGYQVQLKLEGVKFSERTDSVVAVFLNFSRSAEAKDPRRAQPRKRSAQVSQPRREQLHFQDSHFAGCFTFFDHAHHHKGGLVSVLDITKTVDRLRQAGAWRSDVVTVTLVRVSPGTRPRSFQGTLTFDRVNLSRCKAEPPAEERD